MKIRWIVLTGSLLFGAACNNAGKNNMTERKTDSKISNQFIAASNQTETDSMPGMGNMQDTNRKGMNMQNMKGMNIGNSLAQVTLSPREQMLAGVHTSIAELQTLDGQVVLTGTTIFDPQKTNMISAWVSGWIENLYVRNPGERISKGQKLYDLYSPELLSAEKDYLLALNQKNLFRGSGINPPAGQAGFSATLEAMKQKLLRWGLTASQIKQLPLEKPTGKVTIYSKVSGYLIQKLKEQGDYANEGDPVLNLADNNILWVQAQLYDTELPLAEENPALWVKLDGFSGENLPGKIVYDNPVNVNNSRIHLLNISIPNPGGKIQPGMLAYVYLQTPSGKPVLTIPASSVIYDAHHDYVWTALPDNRFERHIVKLGAVNNDLVQILQGINPGDRIVSSGAYLVNSEYILKFGSGVNMAGMQMSDMKIQGRGK
jgi:Cu(I)/Ag(I) efflux system membrane fusion protein